MSHYSLGKYFTSYDLHCPNNLQQNGFFPPCLSLTRLKIEVFKHTNWFLLNKTLTDYKTGLRRRDLT